MMYDDMKKISAIFDRYRTYYKVTDFILAFVIIYFLLYYFNATLVFSGYVEYYIVDALSLDRIMVIGVSGLVAGGLIVILYWKRTPVNTVSMIESRYEWMKERLQTACDSMDEDNVVAKNLRTQVEEHLGKVNTGLFLDRKHLWTRIVLSLIVTAALVGVSYTQSQSELTPNDITRFIDQISGELPEGNGPSDGSQDGDDGEIFGETSVASINGEKVELLIVPGLGTTITIRHTGEEDGVQFIPSRTYPVDVVSSAAADERYQAIQQLAPLDRDLIKEYAVLHSTLLEE